MSASNMVDPGAAPAQIFPRKSLPLSRTVWLPPAISASILLLIAAASIWLTRRIDVARYNVANLETTDRDLNQFQISFLDQVAAWRSYEMQPLPATLGQVRAARLLTHGNLERLEADAGRVGAQHNPELAELRHLLTQWEAAPLSILDGDRTGRRNQPQERVDITSSVLAQAAELDRTIVRQWQAEGSALRSLERLRLILLTLLFPVALLSIMLTVWSNRQAARNKLRAARNAEYEELLRDTMAALAGEKVFPAALGRIAANAMRLALADGAFIEQTDAGRKNVEIAASAGIGSPPLATRVPFADSVTAELVRTGATDLDTDLSAPPHASRGIAPAGWPHCYTVAVPLLDKGDLIGALVVIARHPFSTREETVSRLEPLAAWSALALHRQSLFYQLEEERARLEAVIREMPVGVVLAEAPSGRVAMFNRHAVELWGSPPHVPQSIDEYDNWGMLHPGGEPYETKQRPVARSILKGELVHGETAEIERPDGSRRVVRVSSAPVRDAHGGIIAAVGTVSDITEEKRLEEQAHFLDEVSRQLASTLDYDETIEAVLKLLVPRLADAASIHHRLENQFVRTWAAACSDPTVTRLFQTIDSEYPLPLPSPHPVAVAIRTGKPQLHEFVDDDLLQEVSRDQRELEWLRSLGLQSVIAVPMTVRDRTTGALCIMSVNPGHHFTCEDLDFAQEIGRRVALAADNAKLFRLLNETARTSRFLAETAHSLSASLEPDEVLRRVTRLAVPFFADFAVAYVKNQKGDVEAVAWAHQDPAKEELLAEAARLHRPDQRGLDRATSRALRTGEPFLITNLTDEILDKEHFDPRVHELLRELRPVSWMTVPLVARDDVLGVIMFAVVEPKRRFKAEDVLLGQRLTSRAALAMQNATFYQNVQKALTARDEVLAVVSHDLRNPLQTIAMSVQLMEDVPLERLQQLRSLQVIGRAKDQMDRLIQDLLDVVRLDAGKSINIECRRESASIIISEACESFGASAQEKGVALSCNARKDLPDVWVDAGRIVQVLSNLLTNALKFTPKGGKVEVSAEEERGMVRVRVQDTGIGIAEEELDRIFDAFWQVPRTARLGAGLGLAISRGIIEQHGGKISVESKEGAGATFTFTLPTPRVDHQAQAAD